jgi:hypothetical protein
VSATTVVTARSWSSLFMFVLVVARCEKQRGSIAEVEAYSVANLYTQAHAVNAGNQYAGYETVRPGRN